MTTKVVPGILIATPDKTEVAREASARVGRLLREAQAARGRASLALSGGNTPRETYALLAREVLDWKSLDVFWVDERAVPPTSDRSNYRLAKESLLDAVGLAEAQVHRLRGEAPDLDAEARRYEDELRAHVAKKRNGVPSIDAMIMGIGDDGHTASLFPGEPEVDVTDRLVLAVPAAKGREARLTLSTPVIEAAGAVVVLALGKGKYEPLERAWLVAGSERETPARILRNVQGSLAWIIDRAAGGVGDP